MYVVSLKTLALSDATSTGVSRAMPKLEEEEKEAHQKVPVVPLWK